MGKILEFDFMYYDIVCEHVEIDLETMDVQGTAYTDEIICTPLFSEKVL